MVSFSRTTDGGLSWGTNARLDSAGTGVDAHDPAIAAAGSAVHVTWLDRRNGGGDQTFFATSSDSGASFGGDFQIGATPASADAGPPAIALGEDIYLFQGTHYVVTALDADVAAGPHRIKGRWGDARRGVPLEGPFDAVTVGDGTLHVRKGARVTELALERVAALA